MHLGNMLCALLAWASARKQNGCFLLRIEDLDAMRCPRAFADVIIDDLRWLGIDWDGDILYQSERSEIYARYEGVLRERGLLYPCFCSRAELHAASAPHLSDGRVVYPGTCRGISPKDAAARSIKRHPAIRVRVPDENISFTDRVFGEYCENLSRVCGDFIVRRSDGVFAYQLAVVVDDALSCVTEVVRGSDLLSSAARQIWLHRTLGFNPPSFAHIPLLCASDGRRLSKRDGDTGLESLRGRLSPEQLIGMLSNSAGLIDRAEPLSLKELIEVFDWDKLKPQFFLK